jgi:hypothetical protein
VAEAVKAVFRWLLVPARLWTGPVAVDRDGKRFVWKEVKREGSPQASGR